VSRSLGTRCCSGADLGTCRVTGTVLLSRHERDDKGLAVRRTAALMALLSSCSKIEWRPELLAVEVGI
jgi:hypothetical protein